VLAGTEDGMKNYSLKEYWTYQSRYIAHAPELHVPIKSLSQIRATRAGDVKDWFSDRERWTDGE